MKISKSIVIQKMGDEFVAYDTKSSTMHELNESAYFLLSLIKKGNTKNDLVKSLVEKYNIDKNVAKKDVSETIELFIKKGLVA